MPIYVGIVRVRHLRVVARHLKFSDEFGERWNIVVALDHGGDGTEAAHGRPIKRPYRIDNRRVVRIDNIVTVVVMSGQMELAHALDRHRVQIGHRVEVVIARANENIIDVEQDQAVRTSGDGVQKLPFRHRRVRITEIA